MTCDRTRRRVIVAGGTAALALAAPGTITGQDDLYTDAEELLPPPELFGPEWVRSDDPNETAGLGENGGIGENGTDENGVDENGTDGDEADADGDDGVGGILDELDAEGDAEQLYEAEESVAYVGVSIFPPDTELEQALENVLAEAFVTGTRVEIGEGAVYDEFGAFAGVVVYDRNALAILLATEFFGVAPLPARFVALEGATDLIEYWREDVL